MLLAKSRRVPFSKRMLKICGGEWKGQLIKAPSGNETRPTSAFLRESIFNMLINGIGHMPSRVLDLFAGTGSLGLEALSHGAQSAVFIEGSPKTLKILDQNVSKLAKSKSTQIFKEADLVRWRALLSKQSNLRPFDTIFCDPPYRKKLIDKAFRLLDDDSLWTEDAIWVAEMAPEEEITQSKWQKIKEKIHGDSKVVIFKRLK